MPGKPQRSGGARPGTGPIRRRYTLTGPAALFVRELARSKHRRKDVTEDELNATLEGIIQDYAQRLEIPEPDD